MGSGCSAACEVLVPQPRIKPTSPALKGRFLTTGPPGKFLGLPIFKEDIISRQGILKGWWSKGVSWSLALRHVFCPCFFWCLEKVLRASPMTWVFVTLFRLLLRCFNFDWHFCNFEFHLTLNSIPFPEDHCYKDLTPPTQTGPLPPSNCPLLSVAPCSPPHPSGSMASGEVCASTMPATGKPLLSTHSTDADIETALPSLWKTYRQLPSGRFHWENRKTRAGLLSVSAANPPCPALALQSQTSPFPRDVSPSSSSRNLTWPLFSWIPCSYRLIGSMCPFWKRNPSRFGPWWYLSSSSPVSLGPKAAPEFNLGVMWDSVPCFKAAAASSTSWKLSCSLVAHLLNPPFHTGGVSSLGSSSEQTDLRRGRKTASGVLRVRGCLVGIIVATSLHLGTRPESRI